MATAGIAFLGASTAVAAAVVAAAMVGAAAATGMLGVEFLICSVANFHDLAVEIHSLAREWMVEIHLHEFWSDIHDASADDVAGIGHHVEDTSLLDFYSHLTVAHESLYGNMLDIFFIPFAESDSGRKGD